MQSDNCFKKTKRNEKINNNQGGWAIRDEIDKWLNLEWILAPIGSQAFFQKSSMVITSIIILQFLLTRL